MPGKQIFVLCGIITALMLMLGFVGLQQPNEAHSPNEVRTENFRAFFDNSHLLNANQDALALDSIEVIALDDKLRKFLAIHLEREPVCANAVLPRLTTYIRIYRPERHRDDDQVSVFFVQEDQMESVDSFGMPIFTEITDGGTERFVMQYSLKTERVGRFSFIGLHCNELEVPAA